MLSSKKMPQHAQTLLRCLVARIGECILKAAAEEQASYETLLVAASAEMGAISKERASLSLT
jgi:hypothetical protein